MQSDGSRTRAQHPRADGTRTEIPRTGLPAPTRRSPGLAPPRSGATGPCLLEALFELLERDGRLPTSTLDHGPEVRIAGREERIEVLAFDTDYECRGFAVSRHKNTFLLRSVDELAERL